MAKVRLARGTDYAIRNSAGIDGRIYMAKDTQKVYIDSQEGNNIIRKELNQGVYLDKCVLNWNEKQSTVEQSIELIDIPLNDSNTIIFVIGTNEAYYNQEVTCTEAINTNTLKFERTGTEKIDTEFDLFIYSSAGNSRSLNQEIIPDDTIEWTEVFDANGLYQITQPLGYNANDSVIMTTNTAGIIKAENNENMTTTIYSTYIPEEELEIYGSKLPDNSVLTTVINTDNVIVLPNNIDTSIITQVFVQPLEENTEFNNITEYEWESGLLYARGTTITADIPVTILLLNNEDSVIKNVTISKDNWEKSGTKYINIIALPLVCANDLTPIISCETNNLEYNYITDITVNKDSATLTCIATQKPTNNIELVVTDFI